MLPASSNMHIENVAHPFHVSATEMEYNERDKRVEVSTKIFTDDFEAVLQKLYKTKVDFNNATLKNQNDNLVKKYILTHLSIRSGNNILSLHLYGWEVEREAVFVYTIADAPQINIKSISVENTVLYDAFTDQVNIVHFIVNGKRKSTELNYPDRKAEFSF